MSRCPDVPMFDVPMLTRFAPAPTGFLHLGHVVNAIFVWGLARSAGGRVLLRIEDHDRRRCRPEYERALIEDLEWLGFTWDGPIVRQRDRSALYAAALASLRDRQLTYACVCSRSEIEAAIGSEIGSELRYPGTCAGKGLPDDGTAGVRVRLADDVETFVDLQHGPIAQRPSEQCGDLLIRDRDGNWTYQFAVTVDDWDQGVTHVIRGDDLLASAGRQIALGRLIGRPEPARFLHHPLVMKTAAQKLSKSDADTGVRDLRAAGWTPAKVIGEAARLAGLTDTLEPHEAKDVGKLVGHIL